jgi:hypothetical protein
METESSPEVKSCPAVEFCCARCSKIVLICRSCWRNQSYCSEACASEAKVERHRRNQKKYRETEVGVANHKASQKRYRLRASQKNQD